MKTYFVRVLDNGKFKNKVLEGSSSIKGLVSASRITFEKLGSFLERRNIVSLPNRKRRVNGLATTIRLFSVSVGSYSCAQGPSGPVTF